MLGARGLAQKRRREHFRRERFERRWSGILCRALLLWCDEACICPFPHLNQQRRRALRQSHLDERRLQHREWHLHV